MKKLFGILAVVAAMLIVTSCGGGNSPKGVADKALSALQDKDYDKFVDYVYIKAKNSEDLETGKKMLSGLLQSKGDKEYEKKGGIKGYEIISETIDETGEKAVVEVKMEYGNGDTKDEKFDMVKDENGDWKIDAGK